MVSRWYKKVKKKIIFGLGTGRCGTSSFAFLINSQQSSFFAHELSPILPWEFEEEVSYRRSDTAMSLIQFKFDQIMHQAHNYDIVGDSGNYYLPYVDLLIRSLGNSDDFDLKCVVLKREKSETVKSFLEKFRRQNNNPLQNHNGPKNHWDNSFPKYDNFWTIEESIGKYYDDYYRISSQLAHEHPKFVKVFEMKDLNSEEGVKSIFKFLEIENPLVLTGIKKNVTEVS